MTDIVCLETIWDLKSFKEADDHKFQESVVLNVFQHDDDNKFEITLGLDSDKERIEILVDTRILLTAIINALKE